MIDECLAHGGRAPDKVRLLQTVNRKGYLYWPPTALPRLIDRKEKSWFAFILGLFSLNAAVNVYRAPGESVVSYYGGRILLSMGNGFYQSVPMKRFRFRLD